MTPTSKVSERDPKVASVLFWLLVPLTMAFLCAGVIYYAWFSALYFLPQDSAFSSASRASVFLTAPLDAVCGLLQRTDYAPGYLEDTFKALPLGVNANHAHAVLGEPLQRTAWQDGEAWRYSQQRTGTDDYLVRVLIFDAAGVLTEKDASCYFD